MKTAWSIFVLSWLIAGCRDTPATPQQTPTERKHETATQPENHRREKPTVGSASQKTPKTSTTTEPTAKPRLINFSRDNCLPCEIMRPWWDAIKQAYGSTVDIVEMNLDEQKNRATGQTLKVSTVPTQIYLTPTDEERYRHEGLATHDEMKRVLCHLKFISCM